MAETGHRPGLGRVKVLVRVIWSWDGIMSNVKLNL